METKRARGTTIWFTTTDDWLRYEEAKRVLKEDRHTPSTWFHLKIKELLDAKRTGRKRGNGTI